NEVPGRDGRAVPPGSGGIGMGERPSLRLPRNLQPAWAAGIVERNCGVILKAAGIVERNCGVILKSRLKVLAGALAATNLLLWHAVPWLRDSFDAMTGRLGSPHRPMFLNGVQELLVYYDPWLARGVFPAVYTLGFVAIAFLCQPPQDPAGADPGQ